MEKFVSTYSKEKELQEQIEMQQSELNWYKAVNEMCEQIEKFTGFKVCVEEENCGGYDYVVWVNDHAMNCICDIDDYDASTQVYNYLFETLNFLRMLDSNGKLKKRV